MRNFKQPADTIPAGAPQGGVHSGDAFLSGGHLVVATTDAAEGAVLAVATRGVFELPKEPDVAFAVNDSIYWDAANKRLSKTANGNTLVGPCTAAAGQAATVAEVAVL